MHGIVQFYWAGKRPLLVNLLFVQCRQLELCCTVIFCFDFIESQSTCQVEFSIANLLVLPRIPNDNNGRENRPRISVIEQVQVRWKEIGVLLGFQLSDLTTIEEENAHTKARLMYVIDKWIRNSAQQSNDRYSPTWDGLISLLRDIEEPRLADQLVTLLAVGNN